MNCRPNSPTLPTPEQLHRPDHVRPEDVDRARDAHLPAGGEAVGVGAADEDGPGAEAERLDDVAAAADAAVDEDFGAVADRVEHLRQHAQRRGDAVQLPAAMVGDDDAVGSGVERLARVVRGVDALDEHRPVPGVADPAEVGPRHHRLLERGADVGVGHRPAVGQDHVGELHHAAVAQEPDQPARAGEELWDERQHRADPAGEELSRAVAEVPLAHPGDRGVDGHDERRIAGGSSPLHHRR